MRNQPKITIVKADYSFQIYVNGRYMESKLLDRTVSDFTNFNRIKAWAVRYYGRKNTTHNSHCVKLHKAHW